MKANLRQSKTRLKSTGEEVDERLLLEIQEHVKAEITARYDELYKSISEDVCAQTLAYVFQTLESNYGWREQRLKGFATNLQEMVTLAMSPPSPLLQNFDSDSIEAHLKEKYGLDLRNDFKPQFKNVDTLL